MKLLHNSLILCFKYTVPLALNYSGVIMSNYAYALEI